MGEVIELIADLSIGGINQSDISEGGPLCWRHTPPAYRVKETLFGIALGLISLFIGLQRHVSPIFSHSGLQSTRSAKAVTAILYAIFLVEIGYKVSSKQLIFLWMPCHLITIVQLYLLTSLCLGNSSWYQEYTFRIMLHLLHGPLTAILFPVTECLRLPFEAEVYWIQHFFIFIVVPPYLLKNHFNLSGPGEFSWSWSFLSYGIWMLIHWILLQVISLISGANVGAMLCPASSDPFAGRHYRLYGIGHQLLSILLMQTLWASIESYFIHPVKIKKEA